MDKLEIYDYTFLGKNYVRLVWVIYNAQFLEIFI